MGRPLGSKNGHHTDPVGRFNGQLRMGELSDDGITCHLLYGYDKSYGKIRLQNGTVTKVHRFAWELINGPIPNGYDVDHRPDCPKNCVEINHLQILPAAEHVKLGWKRGEMRATYGTLGKSMSDETKKKISKSHRARYING